MGKVMRYALVLLWITVLSMTAVVALRGTASRELLNIRDAPKHGSLRIELRLKEALVQGDGQPFQIYEQWMTTSGGTVLIAPVSAVLDEMWPQWGITPRTKDPHIWVDHWQQSFHRVEQWLTGLADQREVNNDTYAINPKTVPAAFRGEIDYEQFTRLPHIAVTWIEGRRTAMANTAKILDLTNAGIIVLVLGAFGAVLFLLHSLVSVGEHGASVALGMEEFFFRPFVGAFLAVALLIADIVTHAVISTGSVVQIRHEPMYLLALAAGLLSEKAYRKLEKVLNTGIRDEDISRTAAEPAHVKV